MRVHGSDIEQAKEGRSEVLESPSRQRQAPGQNSATYKPDQAVAYYCFGATKRGTGEGP